MAWALRVRLVVKSPDFCGSFVAVAMVGVVFLVACGSGRKQEDPCSAELDCASGFTCVVESSDSGTCEKDCSSNSDCGDVCPSGVGFCSVQAQVCECTVQWSNCHDNSGCASGFACVNPKADTGAVGSCKRECASDQDCGSNDCGTVDGVGIPSVCFPNDLCDCK